MPLAISPYFTIPSISVITAVSRGLRASNNSTTRGRPPVMSLVLVGARGIFADLAVLHDSVEFRDHGSFARLARFEQFDHARQTARDVLGLGGRARDLG